MKKKNRISLKVRYEDFIFSFWVCKRALPLYLEEQANKYRESVESLYVSNQVFKKILEGDSSETKCYGSVAIHILLFIIFGSLKGLL